MSATAAATTALTRAAFATLLLIAFMMGANHVAARVAFNHGVDVATAVGFRSTITAVVVGLLLVIQQVPVRLTVRHRRALPGIGVPCCTAPRSRSCSRCCRGWAWSVTRRS